MEEVSEVDEYLQSVEETAVTNDTDFLEDDLDSFDWAQATQSQIIDAEEEPEPTIMEDDLDNLLGDFLSKMNK